MAIFNVEFYKEYVAHIQIEANSAAEAAEMISDGDFSKAIEDSYYDEISDEYIFGGRVYAEDAEHQDEPLCEWRNGDR